VPSIKPLQSVALVAVLIQSLSVVDAGARSGRNAANVSTAIADNAAKEKTALNVDRRDAAIDTIVPANATMERVATGFTWVEGPIWIPAGYLLFAEITSNSIRKLTPDGTVSIFLQPSGYKGTAPMAAKNQARMA